MSREADLYKDKIEVSLDGRQIFYLFFGGAVIVGLVFVLGVMVGRRVEARGHVPRAHASSAVDPLAALDRLEGNGGLSFKGALMNKEGEAPASDVERTIGELEKKRADKLIDKHVDKAVAKPSDSNADKIASKPDDKAADKAADKATEKADKSADKSGDKPGDKGADKSADKVADKGAEKSIDKPADKVAAADAAKPGDKPVTKPSDMPAAKPSDKADKVASKPADKPVDAAIKPADKAAKPATDKPTDKVADAKPVTNEAKPEEKKSKYTLQLSSFQDKAEADAFLSTIKASGYQAYVTEASVTGKGTFYRVRMGTYKSIDAANDAKAEFEKASKKTASVMKL